MAQTVDVMVDGGKANPGPLGPSLGPTGVNIGEVVQAINEKTKEFAGMKVPVSIEIDDKRRFTISVGLPPATALIKEKAGLKSGSGNAKTTMVANISWDDVISIAKMKNDNLLGADLKAKAKEIVGTCVSMGVTIDGNDPRDVTAAIKAGQHDDRFQ